MSMKKYTTPEKAEVFYGQDAVVLNRHLKRTGKALSDFSEEELADFNSDLEKVKEKEAKDSEAEGK